MTDKNEVLELAKKCGAVIQDVVPYDKRPEYRTITFNEPIFLAFDAALEEKHQAQIARLRAAVSIAIERSMNFRPVVGKEFAQLEQALSATQQSSDAFLAEVRAKALEDVQGLFIPDDELLSCWAGYEVGALPVDHKHYGKNFDARRLRVSRHIEQGIKAAILRNSAAQPEGKDGGE